MAAKEEAAKSTSEDKPKKRQRKEVLEESTSDNSNTKKAKVAYELDKDSTEKIEKDSVNQKLWDTCKNMLQEGKMVI